ncbi:hypothetical protein TKK_0014549 [Trichogramma kaykai]
MIRLYANNKHTDIIETKKIKNFDRNKSKFPYDAFVHTGYDENSVKIFEPAAILAISDDYDTLSKPVKRWTKPNKRNFEKKESVQEAEKSMGQKVDLLNFENLYSEKVDEKDIMIAALQKQLRDMEKKLQSNEKSEVEKMESNNDTFNDRSHQQMLSISKNKQQFAGGSHETPTSQFNISLNSLSVLNRSHERKRLEKRTPEQSANFSKSKKKKIASENDSHGLARSCGFGNGSHETPTSLLNISSKSLSVLNRSHERKRLEKRTPEQSANFSKSKKKKIASENDSHGLARSCGFGNVSHETPTSQFNISSKSLSALNRSHERKRLEKRTVEQSADFSKSKKKKIESENDSHDLTPIIRGGSRVVRKSLQGFRKTLMSQSNSPISTQMPDLSNSHIPESDKDEESDSSIVSIKKKEYDTDDYENSEGENTMEPLTKWEEKSPDKKGDTTVIEMWHFILEYLFH